MSVSSTSTNAYYQEVLPTLGERHRAVLKHLIEYDKDFSNSELSGELGWPINTVTPRIHELREKGLVKEVGKRLCEVTGREVKVWALVRDDYKVVTI